ncbi:hypothetical protein [Nocardia flavorosea]|uniref:Transcriptional regulator n=1 Tax=Nocardia flavorosea TaxID=53429 RepID=A0A846YP80_9NOCA|nr:hypothetical protein [Nocardia flavorosea]NKY59390.1 hypothetical protein [Nocardia flavorosea]
MSVQRREAIRNLSAAIFGNRYMVDVVSAIARLAADNEDEGITVRMIATATATASHAQVPDALVKQVVKRLVDAGVMAVLPRSRPRGPLYHRLDRSNRAWRALAHLSTELEADPPSIATTTQPSPHPATTKDNP